MVVCSFDITPMLSTSVTSEIADDPRIHLQFDITPGAIQKFTVPSLLHKGPAGPQTPPPNLA